MKSEPVMTDARPIDQPALHHQPAYRSLRRAEGEERQRPGSERSREVARTPEEDERNHEHDADRARREAMEILPEKDLLEFAQAHSAPQLLVLRKLPVAIEHVVPLRVVERGDDAHQRLPVDDRETRMGQPRDAADHDDGEGHRRDAREPEPQTPPLCVRQMQSPVRRRLVALPVWINGRGRSHLVLQRANSRRDGLGAARHHE